MYMSDKPVLPLRVLFTVCIQLLVVALAMAQPQPPDHDSTYYTSFAKSVTARFYFSRKYTRLELERPEGASKFVYEPNTKLNMGIGATYQSLTVNLAYGFGFLNNEKDKGKTKYVDLQSHLYGRKWTIDLLCQFYKGYYLTPQGLAAKDANSYYIRPDLHLNVYGAAAYRLLNPTRFSYRAAMVQNERQEKSSGSFLLGIESYYGLIKADSSLVPAVLSDIYRQKGVRKLWFAKIGPGAGYAHTFVIEKKFFFSASLTANLGISYIHQVAGDTKGNKVTITPGYIYRMVGGYDHGNFNINFSVVGNQLVLKTVNTEDRYFITTGNYRITFAKRFEPGPRLKKRLHPINMLLLRM
jgi:hypothetical protein